MYAVLKASNAKYLERMDWKPKEQRYKNAKFIYGWHLMPDQEKKNLIIKLSRFLTEKYIKGH